MRNECFGKIISGNESTTPKGAWETFDIALKCWCKWLKGYKYWRAEPELLKDDINGVMYVRARIICSLIEIEGADSVDLKIVYDNTYKEKPKGDTDMSGLAIW